LFIKGENKWGETVGKKIKILLALGIILMIIGIFLNINEDPFLWGTGAVTALFVTLLFGIDPLSPKERQR
jgi:ACR3 family arsenite efflux pump ArsB